MSSTLENDDELELEHVLEFARDAWLNEVHTTFPARVESYDADAQVADLKPMVRRAIPNDAGGTSYEDFPILRAVRVAWLRTDEWFLHMPVKVGSFMHVHCAERDFTRWAQTGDVGDPIDERNHSLSNAYAVPGFYPRTKSLASMPSDALAIGKVGGAIIQINGDGSVDVGASSGTQLAAIAALVKAELDKIVATLATGTVQVAGAPVSVVWGTPYVSGEVKASQTRVL